jgi:hypothetical protein
MPLHRAPTDVLWPRARAPRRRLDRAQAAERSNDEADAPAAVKKSPDTSVLMPRRNLAPPGGSRSRRPLQGELADQKARICRYSRSVFPALFLVLTSAALMGCVMVAHAAVRARRRPAQYLVFASTACKPTRTSPVCRNAR